MITQDEKYMLKAISLAKRGLGAVEPNPAVGCVIVKANKIIGQGWHKKFGAPHAEINALEDCRKKGNSPKGAVMYVTLEPCCHTGKTGPCTKAIIEAGVSKVFIAIIDPSKYVNGKGIRELCNAGIEVQTGLCRQEAKRLNAPFIKYVTTGRGWVILKWAQSIDGKLAWTKESGQRWISGQQSRRDAHKLRRRASGILVGIETVLTDDPELTARPAKGSKAVRIVLDRQMRIPLDCKLLNMQGPRVFVVTSKEAVEQKKELAEKIREKGAEILVVPVSEDKCDLKVLLEQLSSRGVQQLLVEGGAEVISSFLKEGLTDECVVYIGPMILGNKGKIDIGTVVSKFGGGIALNDVDIKRFGEDVRITGFSKNLRLNVT